jgi:hypothetical protein
VIATALPPLPELYDYQTDAVTEIRSQILSGRKRILLVAPTGCGKGTIATWMIHRAVARGSRILFLVNRRELVKDTSRRLDRLGVDHGIIMGNHPRRKPWLHVHIASIDTLQRRDPLPPADLIFVDECHFAISPIWRKVLDRYSCPVIGMTATPVRADGRGLGEFFDAMVSGPVDVSELMSRNFLVRARIFAPSAPDLTGVAVSHGEYNQKQLARVVDGSKIIGDVVQHWMKLGRGRPTVAFAVSSSTPGTSLTSSPPKASGRARRRQHGRRGTRSHLGRPRRRHRSSCARASASSVTAGTCRRSVARFWRGRRSRSPCTCSRLAGSPDPRFEAGRPGPRSRRLLPRARLSR